jgi:hypothetical protein
MAKGKWLRIGSPVWDNPLSADPPSQYQDENGVIWKFRVERRDDGWYKIEARPWKPGDAYDTPADRWPMSALSADSISKDTGTDEARAFIAESIDSVVAAKGSKGGTLLLLLLALWLIGTDERRYVSARDEQWF